MLKKFLQLSGISCRHKHISKPFAAAAANGSSALDWDPVSPDAAAGHYVVCFDCGKQFSYDWSQMRIAKG